MLETGKSLSTELKISSVLEKITCSILISRMRNIHIHLHICSAHLLDSLPSLSKHFSFAFDTVNNKLFLRM